MTSNDPGLTLLLKEFDGVDMSPDERTTAKDATAALYRLVGELHAKGLCTRSPVRRTVMFASFDMTVEGVGVVFRYRCSPSKNFSGKCEWAFRGRTRESSAMYEKCQTDDWRMAVQRLEQVVLRRPASQSEATTWWCDLTDPRRQQIADALSAFCDEAATLRRS